MNVIKKDDVEMESFKMPIEPFRLLMLKKCAFAMQADWTTACMVMEELKKIGNMINGEERDLYGLDYLICCEVTKNKGKEFKRYWYEL